MTKVDKNRPSASKIALHVSIIGELVDEKKEPNPDLMNMYMMSFVNQMNDLSNDFTLEVYGKMVLSF